MNHLICQSGAGKTTLMDVIALRKESGNISGDVLLNGFPQESISFRRCSGYVEQFGKSVGGRKDSCFLAIDICYHTLTLLFCLFL